jgi:hypothetical protein
MPTRITKRFGLYFTLVLIVCARPGIAAGPPDAAFQKLRSLAGDWEGKDEQGNAVKTSFKLIAGDTAVMETLNMSEMEEMVTLYSVDGDGIALLHYCPTNNQPHMRAVPPSGDIRELVFEFQGAGNLPDLSMGHEHKLVMEFQDNGHLTEHWTWRKKGKDTEMVYHFARKAVA